MCARPFRRPGRHSLAESIFFWSPRAAGRARSRPRPQTRGRRRPRASACAGARRAPLAAPFRLTLSPARRRTIARRPSFNPVSSLCPRPPISIPVTQVYPVLAAVGAGIGCTIYSIVFNFRTNPDVRVNKSRRTDAASEDPAIVAQGLGYKKSMYRGIGSVGKP